jgi:multiple antibiotic resistance protein
LTALDPHFVATAFTTAFTIIDPLGMIPLSLAVTVHNTAAERRAIVTQATIVAALIILFMAVLGRALFDYLGITLPAFTIAGGILLFLIAVDMLFARPTGAKQTEEEERAGSASGKGAVFPLAIPMIAGPGTIATVLVLSNLTHGDHLRMLVIVAAYAVALLVTWACMLAGSLIIRAVGATGIHVATRLLGILLAALAVQFVVNGLGDVGLIHRP